MNCASSRVISAAKQFIEDQNSLYPLNPVWDTRFMSLLEQGRLAELDAVSNEELSAMGREINARN